MIFRLASENDIKEIMCIVEQAQQWLKENKVNQWQNNYPNYEIFQDDILRGYCHVLTHENKLLGMASLVFLPDSNYKTIYDGKWLGEHSYISIHRIAIGKAYKNTKAASELMEYIEKYARNKKFISLRVDTHEDNMPMQKYLIKNKFVYCGIIFLADGDKQLAYEKIIV